MRKIVVYFTESNRIMFKAGRRISWCYLQGVLRADDAPETPY